MKQANISATTKDSGLRAFQRQGWVLVDATYEPVNEFSSPERDKIIRRDYPHLRDGVRKMTGSTPTAIVLRKGKRLPDLGASAYY